MGKLIDEGLLQEKLALIPMEERTFRRTVEELENASPVEAIEKADYEARLKADLEAILVELQLKIEELDTYDVERTHGLIENAYISEEVDNIIQQKIDKLRGKVDEK